MTFMTTDQLTELILACELNDWQTVTMDEVLSMSWTLLLDPHEMSH